MAERASESPDMGDHKHLPKDVGHDVEQSHEHRGVPVADDDDDDDYTVERVEAVYRKLDLRIIPGVLPIFALETQCLHILTPLIPQPSGFCTSYALPSAPTSALRRP